jgi:hypothetical protein
MDRMPRRQVGRLIATIGLTLFGGEVFSGDVFGGEARAATSTAPAVTSKFVTLSESNCKSIADNGGEDWARLLCKGTVDGWSVIIDYDDARDSITLRKGKADTPLSFYATVTGYFATVGDKFEFRMRKGKAIGSIVRLVHHLNGESPDQKVSVLVVSRLSPTPCVIAVVQPGSKQATTARGLADNSTGKPCRTSTE